MWRVFFLSDESKIKQFLRKKVLGNVVKCIKDMVCNILMPYNKLIAECKSVYECIWNKMQEWLTKVTDMVDSAVKVLQDSAMWAIAILLGAGVLHMCEKVLISLGVFSTGGVVVGSFLTLICSYFAIKGVGIANEKIVKMTALFSGLCKAMITMPSDSPVFNEEGIALQGPTSMMKGFASVTEWTAQSLSGFNTESLIQWGRVGAALENLRKGKDVLSTLLATLLGVIGDVWDSVTGKKNKFFHELSSLVAVDVKQWVAKAQDCLLEAQTLSISDPYLLLTVNKLVKQGNDILTGVTGLKRRLSNDFSSTVSRLLHDLREVRKNLVKAGDFFGRRVRPFWLYLYGQAQCGKSNLMQEAACAMLEAMNLPVGPDSIYTKSATDSYWSGYERQYCVAIDDLSAIVAEHASLECEMMNLVSCADYRPNMPFEGEKGLHFDSKLIVSTSNVYTAPTDAKILDMNAFNSRRALTVECRRAEVNGVAIPLVPGDILATTECRIVGSNHEGPGENPWMFARVFLDTLKGKVQAYMFEEEKLQAAYMDRFPRNNKIFASAEQFLQGKVNTCTMIKTHHFLKEYNIEAKVPDAMFVLEVDDKVYSTDLMGNTKVVPGVTTGGVLEKHCLEVIVPEIQQQFSFACDNVILGNLLSDLVSKEVYVQDVEYLAPGAEQSFVDFFRTLHLSERVYLRLVQKRIDAINKDFDGDVMKSLFGYKQKILSGVFKSYAYVKENGPFIFLILSSVLVLGFVATGFFSILSKIFCGGSLLGGVAAMSQLELQGSVSSEYSHTDSYRSRNLPTCYRRVPGWHKGAQYELQGTCPDALPGSDILISLYVPCFNSQGKFASKRHINVVWCVGSQFLIVRHQALSIRDGTLIELYTPEGKRETFQWCTSMMTSLKDSELILYACPVLPALRKSITEKYFPENLESMMSQSIYDAQFVGLRDPTSHEPKLVSEKIVAHMVRKTFSLNSSEPGSVYVWSVPEYLEYRFTTHMHDCGAMILSFIQGQFRVLGMHISGSSKGDGYACVIPKYAAPVLQGMCYIPEQDIIGPSLEKVGYLEPQRVPRLPTTSSFVKVPDAFKLDIGIQVKEPAILSKFDERLKETEYANYDPIADGILKYSESMKELDVDILHQVALDITEEWADALQEPLDDVPLDVAINGDPSFENDFMDPIVMSTSEGYPHVLSRKGGEKGKIRFFEGEPLAYTLRPNTSVSEEYLEMKRQLEVSVVQVVAVATPKDERLKVSKIYDKPSTRLFDVLPLSYNLILREKFLSFSQFIMKNRDKFPCQVGIKVHSREWQRLHSRLAEKNAVEAYNCDYSKFDSRLSFQLIEKIGFMINTLYRDDPLAQKVRLNALFSIYGRLTIARQKVYRVCAGLPSGCALTVLLNSIFNEILIRYTYRKNAPQCYKSLFSQCVCLVVYGDDNLIAVAPSVSSWFDGCLIKTELASVNITITDGTDKTSPFLRPKSLKEVDFLKRHFKQSDDGMMAPLDKLSLYSSVVWISARQEGDILEKLFQNVQNLLRELYVHGDQEEFSNVRHFYIEKIPTFRPLILTWRQCHDFFLQQRGDTISASEGSVLDIMVTPQLCQFVLTQGSERQAFLLTERVKICGLKYDLGEDEFVVSISIPLKSHEVLCGVHIPPEFCYGNGGSVTRTWVKRFSMSKFPQVARIKAAYAAGKTIVFRDERPHIASWLAASWFTASVNTAVQFYDLIQLYRECTGDKSTALSEYAEGMMAPRLEVYHMCENQATLARQIEKVTGCRVVCDLPDDLQALDALSVRRKRAFRLMGKFPCIDVDHNGVRIYAYMVCSPRDCPGHIHVATDVARPMANVVKHCMDRMC
nr:MAG: polyprotein 1 [Rousettus madagascariensis nepovirus]